MIKNVLTKLIERKSLLKTEAYEAMKAIIGGLWTPSQMAGFLVALRMKGEEADEIAGLAMAMRDHAQPLSIRAKNILDCVGTGGDGKNGFNISTTAAFVVAGAGYTMAKHGNRGISSACGSADVLEVLGVRLDCPTVATEESINNDGIGFMFAPHFHPSMKHIMPTRKELGIRTVFNILGPLANPAKANIQLIGVSQPPLLTLMADVLQEMNHLGGMVIHSHGWDEITLDGPTKVVEIINRKKRTYQLTHTDFGLPKVSSKMLKGGTSQDNAEALRNILNGEKGGLRDVVVANAAALIWLAERSLRESRYKLKDAVIKAAQAIDSGAAREKLSKLAANSHRMD